MREIRLTAHPGAYIERKIIYLVATKFASIGPQVTPVYLLTVTLMITGVLEIHNERDTVVVQDIEFADIAVGHTEVMHKSQSIHELFPAGKY